MYNVGEEKISDFTKPGKKCERQRKSYWSNCLSCVGASVQSQAETRTNTDVIEVVYYRFVWGLASGLFLKGHYPIFRAPCHLSYNKDKSHNQYFMFRFA